MLIVDMPLKLRRRRTFGKSVAWACTDYWYQFSGKDVPNEFRGAHKMWHKCAVSGASPWQWNGTIERCSKLHSTTCTEQDCPSLLTSVCTQNDVMLILNTYWQSIQTLGSIVILPKNFFCIILWDNPSQVTCVGLRSEIGTRDPRTKETRITKFTEFQSNSCENIHVWPERNRITRNNKTTFYVYLNNIYYVILKQCIWSFKSRFQVILIAI